MLQSLFLLALLSVLFITSAGQDKTLITLSWGNIDDVNTVVILTCLSPHSELADKCCSAMSRAAETVSIDKPQEASIMTPLSTTEAEACQRDGSVVPLSKLDGFSPVRFVYQATIPRAQSQQNTNLYAWNDDDRIGIFWKDYDSQTNNNTDLQSFQEVFSKAVSTDPSRAQATLASELSESGGMHRTLHQNLTLSVPDTNKELDVLVLGATILLLIPSDMFMDVEDALEDFLLVNEGTNTLHYDLSVASHKTIDIEQPAFNSPQHAVIIRFAWRGSHNNNEDDSGREKHLKFQFASKVHLRYPKPVQDSDRLYQPVFMMPPLLLDAHLQHVRGFIPVQRHSGSGVHLLQHLWSNDQNENNQKADFITTNVASAPDGDFVWVAAVTVLFSILGAAFIGYETSRISI